MAANDADKLIGDMCRALREKGQEPQILKINPRTSDKFFRRDEKRIFIHLGGKTANHADGCCSLTIIRDESEPEGQIEIMGAEPYWA